MKEIKGNKYYEKIKGKWKGIKGNKITKKIKEIKITKEWRKWNINKIDYKYF